MSGNVGRREKRSRHSGYFIHVHTHAMIALYPSSVFMSAKESNQKYNETSHENDAQTNLFEKPK